MNYTLLLNSLYSKKKEKEKYIKIIEKNEF